jgi:alpha-tubulin suppressor-like RCC1 family protein
MMIQNRVPWAYVALLAILAGCEGEIVQPGGDEVRVILMQPSAFNLTIGGARKIDALPKNAIGTVLVGRETAWVSSSPEVVSVDEFGFVTALASGQATITAEIEGISATAEVSVKLPPVALGRDHTCAIERSARIYCWGLGLHGQLGIGESTIADVPTEIQGQGDRDWVAVSSGAGHSCALDFAGLVACWGRGLEGQLGTGENSPRTSPADLDFPFQLQAVSAGQRHTCGISDRDDRTWCWGWNVSGQIGNGTTVTVSRPVEVLGLPALEQISAGGQHTCAIDRQGGMWCWGDNTHGQIGDGTRTRRLAPERIASSIKFVFVSSGARHTCAIDTAAEMYCWGDNSSGQLGNLTLTSSDTPQPVAGGIEFVSVSSSVVTTCGVASDQRAYCWGLGSLGRLGTGSRLLTPNPVPIGGGAVYTKILAGNAHGCAITFADTMKCWGFGGLGQLGNGKRGNSPVPIDPLGVVRFVRFDG